ncbi:CO(2)-response secreted protease-like isoform X2 [Andrographis paniculata]|uniref:CO(2)-response secreted protease-like isoform X2 n=1 Tax=Andrographis paniculata TaxID=175694 RepID=UPI0021E98CA5|nr:CO(2)-response secreted protease-like isoform X2 [Andrographis paniculata]
MSCLGKKGSVSVSISVCLYLLYTTNVLRLLPLNYCIFDHSLDTHTHHSMASLLHYFAMLQLLLIVMHCSVAINPSPPQPYVIYMGRSWSAGGIGDHDSNHLQLLSSVIPSEETDRRVLLNSYGHAFKGFSAMLTESEASVLSGHDEVLSVFPDPILKLHTTRSWDFLEATESQLRSTLPHEQKSSDVIIGVIDTGIWPESPSFSDHNIGKIPSKWKGVCMEGPDFTKSNCNRKLIGARFYSNHAVLTRSNQTIASPHPTQTQGGSPRDSLGHGTHTSSIAGGSPVENASYYGLARGQARGGLPSARIASYKACTQDGCTGSVILKAIDDAIGDGVDIISISIGGSSIFQSSFLTDAIAIGAFHAEQMGVAVVCSGGNDGPNPYTVVNSAPWIFTVAASTIDRNFQSTILLGNNQSFKGMAINFSPLSVGRRYPLAFGEQVAAKFTPASEARNCVPGSLDGKKVAGKIIVCVNDEPTVSRNIKKLVVEDAKAKGLIIIDSQEESSPFDSGTYPFAQVAEAAGTKLLHYINSTRNPTATILPTKVIENSRPAPVVADFSSRGPGRLTENVLKPDIMAPGVAILAAITPKIESFYGAPGNKPSPFGIKSGTSMACPHVTGAMAFIKSVHPEWSFSMIKSALMTTASTADNMGEPLTNTTGTAVDPHQAGVGEIQPIKALDPGLAFETTAVDHFNFLCYYGYKQKILRSMFNNNFTCPNNLSSPAKQLISSINYPTISIERLSRHNGPRKVKRVVTNLGSSHIIATYVPSVNSPPGLAVKVVPKKLVFRRGMRKASFKVFFDGKKAHKGYNFGDIRWFDGSHIVRVVFAVNVV